MLNSEHFDVFISYHGGQSDDDKSSYKKADELRIYLESKNLKVFLCKHINNDDFYDSINSAILNSDNFILVACDKDMLSEWIYDEVKQFDVLRKNGEKPNCVINAYIFGEITEKDLYSFNTVFSSRDIKRGENGFKELYEQITSKRHWDITKFSVDRDLMCVRYLDLTNFEIEEKIFEKVRKIDPSIGSYMIKYYRELFDFYSIYSIQRYLKKFMGETDVLVIRTHKYHCIEHLLSAAYAADDCKMDFIIVQTNDTSDECDKVLDVRNGKHVSVPEDMEIKYRNVTFNLSPIDNNPNSVSLNLSVNGKHLEMNVVSQEGDDDVPVTCIRFDGDRYSTMTEYLDIEDKDFLSFLIHSVVNKLSNDSLIDDDSLTYFRYQFAEKYDVDKQLASFDIIYKRIVSEEEAIHKTYNVFKSTGTFENNYQDVVEKSRYSSIFNKIKDFYINKNQIAITEAIILLEHECKMCQKNGSHYKLESLLMTMSELIMNNVFVFNDNQVSYKNILNELKRLSDIEIIQDYKNYINTIILSLKKEIVFSGEYEGIADDIPSADNLILEQMTRQIEMLINTNNGQTIFLSQLFMLYRQRAVIWERLGDTTTDFDERMKYYIHWRDDTLQAINYGNMFDSDREILGCAYLNYASSFNRLAKIEKTDEGIKDCYSKCLENLDTAYSLLRGTSAKRYVGYVHLHRSDCYSFMFNSGLYDREDTVNGMNVSSRKAYDIFKETQDLVGNGWALRIMAKGIINSADNDVKTRLIDGLNKLKMALEVDIQGSVIKEISGCIHDFSIYLKIIEDNNLFDDMNDLIKDLFSIEIEAFRDIVKNVCVSYGDLIPIQNSLTLIMNKLLE